MTLVRVCSGFSPSGYRQYGERFLRSFDRHWPYCTQLAVYTEEPVAVPRDGLRDLFTIPGAKEFHDRHKANLAAQGRVEQPCWKAAERLRGYSFRTDAYKFWKQMLIPQAAASDEALGPLCDGDVLVWLDADVETFRTVQQDFVERTLADKDIAFIGREPRHSEIGYWAIRINDAAVEFLSEIAAAYTSDMVFTLPQWHSAFVWDIVRRQEIDPKRESNLNPKGRQGHVWPLTMLGTCMRHDKGMRKGVGR